MKSVKKALSIFLVIACLASVFSVSVSAATSYASYDKKYGCVLPVKSDGKTLADTYSVKGKDNGTFKFSFDSKGYKSNVYFGIALYSDEEMRNTVMSKYGAFPGADTVASLNFDFSELESATYYGITYTYIKKKSNYVIDSNSIYIFKVNLNKVSGTVPEIIVADALYTGNYIEWEKVPYADRYRVYRKTADGESWKKLKDVKELSYLDKTAVKGEKYYYTVRAYDGDCYGSYNKNGAELVYIEAPTFKTTPTLLADNAVNISWKKVSGATGYKVYRKASGDSSYKCIATVENATEYTDTSEKENGTVYYYKVRGINGTVSGLVSSADKIEIFGTVKVTASCTKEKVTLSWNSVKDADSYIIYKKTNSEKEWSKFQVVKAKSTTQKYTFKDTEVYGGNQYSYSLVAEKDGKYSSFDTAGVSVRCLKEPVISSIKAGAENSVVIKWKSVSGAKTYNIYRKSPVDDYILVGTTSSTTFYDTKEKRNNLIYTYYVEAVSGKNVSESGNNTSTFLFMKAPEMVSVKWSDGNVVKWNRVSGATSYIVYRRTPSGSYKQIAEVKGKLTYTDKSVKKSGKYYYTVAAMNGKNEGAYELGYGVNCLNAPELTSISVSKTGSTTVKWAKVSGADGYYVYRKTPDGKWSNIGKTASLSYTDKSKRVSGTEYFYTVKAYNSKGSGIKSSFGLSAVYKTK